MPPRVLAAVEGEPISIFSPKQVVVTVEQECWDEYPMPVCESWLSAGVVA